LKISDFQGDESKIRLHKIKDFVARANIQFAVHEIEDFVASLARRDE
jgi:hypothetical protein